MAQTDTNTITIGGKTYSKIGNIRGDNGDQGSCRNNLFIYERVPSTGGPGLAIEFNGKDYYYIESMGKIYQPQPKGPSIDSGNEIDLTGRQGANGKASNCILFYVDRNEKSKYYGNIYCYSGIVEDTDTSKTV